MKKKKDSGAQYAPYTSEVDMFDKDYGKGVLLGRPDTRPRDCSRKEAEILGDMAAMQMFKFQGNNVQGGQL